MSLHELRRANQATDRMERWLRALPRTGERARRPAKPRQHHRSIALEFRAVQRHVSSMSYTGQTAQESDCGAVLRLAGRLPYGTCAEKLLATGRAQAWRGIVHTLP